MMGSMAVTGRAHAAMTPGTDSQSNPAPRRTCSPVGDDPHDFFDDLHKPGRVLTEEAATERAGTRGHLDWDLRVRGCPCRISLQVVSLTMPTSCRPHRRERSAFVLLEGRSCAKHAPALRTNHPPRALAAQSATVTIPVPLKPSSVGSRNHLDEDTTAFRCAPVRKGRVRADVDVESVVVGSAKAPRCSVSIPGGHQPGGTRHAHRHRRHAAA